jgi:uncharacterized protein with HEPN domain
MNTRDVKVIKKFFEHIEDVSEFVGNMNYEEFLLNKQVKNATAFSIAQIGELTTLLSDEAKAGLTDIIWKDVKSFRNWVIHNYEKVDLLIFWDVIQNGLPEMKAILENFLSNYNQDEIQTAIESSDYSPGSM